MLTLNYFQIWFQQEIKHTSGSKRKCNHGLLYIVVYKEPFIKEFDPQDENVG